jgi:hypothetical protein
MPVSGDILFVLALPSLWLLAAGAYQAATGRHLVRPIFGRKDYSAETIRLHGYWAIACAVFLFFVGTAMFKEAGIR